MDASLFQLSAIGGALTRRRTVWIVGVLAATLTVALALASVFIGIRRIDGHLGEPLSPIALLATGAIVATAAAGARWLAWGAHVVSTNGRAVIIRWLPGVAAVALAGGVSLPGSSLAGLGLLWFAIVAEEVLIWRRSSAARLPAAIARDQRRESWTPTLAPSDRREAALLPERDALSPTGDVVQRLVRTQAAGVDRIQGWLKAELEPNERNATLHVAFCPPFDEMPNLTVVQIAGPECRIKTGQLLPFGIRLELRRQVVGGEKGIVIIEFSAQASLAMRNDSRRETAPSTAPSP
jgi:hypothetical protein